MRIKSRSTFFGVFFDQFLDMYFHKKLHKKKTVNIYKLFFLKKGTNIKGIYSLITIE